MAKATGAPAAEQAADTAPRDKADGAELRPGDRFNTESYARIYENPFFKAQDNPLSTFSVDVDTASYSNTRRFLSDGQLPPPDAVRLEELINYFGYSYPAPRGDAPFSFSAEVSACPWNRAHRLVHIGLQGKRIDPGQVPPRNLVFLLDVSGSMGSPRKLPLLKAAMRLLVNQLREQDRVAMVVYAGASGLVLPPTAGSDKETILSALDRLEAGGSTNGGDGIRLAYNTARRFFSKRNINRVILATDGDFNVGTTSQGDLVRLIEREREHGIFLTVLGLGMGNYKDSTMEMLADKGNGNYAYLDTMAEARKVLVREAGATLVTIAKDVKIQVEFNPAQVKAYRLLGYENRLLRAEDFNDDRKDAGEIGAGHTVTALYEVVPRGAGSATRVRGVDPLRYQTTRKLSGEAHSGELLTLKLRYKEPLGQRSRLLSTPVLDRGLALSRSSDNFRFSAAVAAFGMLLRRSVHRADASFGMVRELARGARGQDPHGYRGEFLVLVDKAAELAGARARMN
jgi:Ca-activated chloride channel family protein